MSRFNQKGTRPRVHTPVQTTGPAATAEGGAGYTRDTMSDLVFLGTTNMVGQDTFYESGADRDSRYLDLVHTVAPADGAGFTDFVAWLRNDANMRTAAGLAGLEGARARLDARTSGEGAGEPYSRRMVGLPLQRADEPGEAAGYWTSKYGRKLPMPVKRGLADAVTRLYSQYSAIKYDTNSKGWSFADVIELVHPEPRDAVQNDLFRYLLDKRHHPDNYTVPDSLTVIKAYDAFKADVDRHPEWLYDAARIREAGLTWEIVLPMAGQVSADKRKVWEALIPNMGIMAQIRNLRNFDQAGVSDAVAQTVINRLMDPAEIARSRQFPYRFLSAYRNAPSLRWSYALERALDYSTINVPKFSGRTLVLVDTSGSMGQSVSDKSAVRHVDIAVLFGMVFANRGANVDLHGFAGQWAWGGGAGRVTFPHDLPAAGSVLPEIERFAARIGEVGHGTQTVDAVRQTYDGHDRVVIISDEQVWPSNGGQLTTSVPPNVPLYVINTSGTRISSIDTSQPNRFAVGGFSDKLFQMISLLERGKDAPWPWAAPTG